MRALHTQTILSVAASFLLSIKLNFPRPDWAKDSIK